MTPRNILVAIGLAAVLAAGVLLALRMQTPAEPQYAFILPAPDPVPEFSLDDQHGKPADQTVFEGQWDLVFFGFTHCPDICPAGLQVITAALDKLGPRAGKIAPLFITVDPERDTPAQMKSYVASFHPSVTGLTGSGEDISAVAKAYRVYYRKAQNQDLSEYTMYHTSFMYLMDAEGRFINHFPHAVMPDKLVERLEAELTLLQ